MLTRWRALTTAALVLALAGACTTGSTEEPEQTRWTPVFTAEFDGAAGTKLAPADWSYAMGTGYPGGATNWGTGQIETATDRVENVALDGAGHLAITPIRTGSGVGTWTSGRVETQRTDFAAPPGGKLRLEATLQQPAVSGAEAAGYWTAFWALGGPARAVGATNWPGIGEWDVMENANGRESVFHTLHCGVPVGGPCAEPGGISSGELPCAGCKTGFHTYAIEFDRSMAPEELRWYVDGRHTFTVKADQVDAATWAAANHHGFFLILNVAIGGVFPTNLGGAPTPATRSGVPMLIDRVAVSTAGGQQS